MSQAVKNKQGTKCIITLICDKFGQGRSKLPLVRKTSKLTMDYILKVMLMVAKT